jgi:transcriptional regulator with XRE-family HTH domain
MDYISWGDPNGGTPAWKPPIATTTTGARDDSEYQLDFGPLLAADLVPRRIEFRRKILRLTTEAVARLSGIDWNTYVFHIESSHRDIFGSCGVGELSKLCAVLDLRFFELFDMDCDFCNSEPCLDEYALPINELICARRVRKGWSREEFGDRIGFLTSGVEELETNPEEIRNWWLDIIEPVAYELELPAQIILDAKCANCGR